MQIDVWFANHDGYLWVISAPHGEEPREFPLRVSGTVSDAVNYFRKNGNKVVEVGICPPDMLGLE
jgi:hypothetical protein